MKRLLALSLLIGAVVSAQEFKLGSKISGFNVQDLSGRTVGFSELKGDVTVVTFISVQCPVSNAYTGRMNAIYKDYSPKRVKFIFVNANRTEPAAAVEEHAKAVGFVFPVYKDVNNELADRFNAQVTPESYVIDSTGTIRYHGSIDDSQNVARVQKQGLRLALDAVLAGSAVSVPEAKAFGCSIKRIRKVTWVLPVALLVAMLLPVDETGFQKLTTAHQGKVVLYEFWATWCEPCRAEMPKLIALQAKLKARGFELVTISADEPEQQTTAKKLLTQSGAPAPAYRKEAKDDGKFINAIEGKWSGALPALFLYDRNGKKVRSFIGETEIGVIEVAIQKLL